MKKQKATPAALVTSVAAVIRDVQDTRPFGADEVRGEKRAMHKVVKDSLAVYAENLKQGKVEIDDTLDLERLIKAAMLIMGEPEGVPQQETQQTVVTLSLDNPDVENVYRLLTADYNQQNDGGSNE